MFTGRVFPTFTWIMVVIMLYVSVFTFILYRQFVYLGCCQPKVC